MDEENMYTHAVFQSPSLLTVKYDKSQTFWYKPANQSLRIEQQPASSDYSQKSTQGSNLLQLSIEKEIFFGLGWGEVVG